VSCAASSGTRSASRPASSCVLANRSGGRRRVGRNGAFIAAVAAHAAAAVFLARLTISFPRSAGRRDVEAPGSDKERLTFVTVAAVPRESSPSASASVAGTRPSAARLRSATAASATDTAGRSAAALTYQPGPPRSDDPRAPAVGVEPRLADARVWEPPGTFAPAAKTATERLDSTVTSWVARANDSVAALTRGARRPGDWTFERRGRKYGIDSQYIHLGKVSIPTAVLALLPLNVQANPTLAEEWRAQSYMRADVMYHAQRAVGDSILKAAAARIRARKERERRESAPRVIAGTPAPEPQGSP
jgi:hypothetical protein